MTRQSWEERASSVILNLTDEQKNNLLFRFLHLWYIDGEDVRSRDDAVNGGDLVEGFFDVVSDIDKLLRTEDEE